jgi:hypothetical protein
MTKMDIYEIKRRTTKSAPYFFSPGTLKFFGQKMSDFKIHKIKKSGNILITAPSYWDIGGRKTFMGKTKRLFNPKKNKFVDNYD